MMRSALLLMPILLLAGCAQVEEPVEGAAAAASDAVAAVASFEAEDTVFLPPSQSQERVVTEIPFVANASGMSGDIVLHLGGMYVVELPAVLADVAVEVRDAAGEVLAEAHLTSAAPDATIPLADLEQGAYTLALLSYGGSDGQANGDFVAWRIAIA